MSDATRMAFAARPNRCGDEELSALAGIYALALRKAAAKQKAAGTNGGEGDPKGDHNDRARTIIPQAE